MVRDERGDDDVGGGRAHPLGQAAARVLFDLSREGMDLLRARIAQGTATEDDAALVEQLGHEIVVVDGDARAMKVTTPADLPAITHHL